MGTVNLRGVRCFVLADGCYQFAVSTTPYWQIVPINLEFIVHINVLANGYCQFAVCSLPCISKWLISIGSFPQQCLGEWLPSTCILFANLCWQRVLPIHNFTSANGCWQCAVYSLHSPGIWVLSTYSFPQQCIREWELSICGLFAPLYVKWLLWICSYPQQCISKWLRAINLQLPGVLSQQMGAINLRSIRYLVSANGCCQFEVVHSNALANGC